ncbi:hypothetical protein ABVK25_009113 [Lepraria finkii]|uniref:HTH APSES-type domain-containing protein n=1 Tax=Lepraria finkii TaxID=1340010 RepID=A0ABR4AYQ1_9LECA
MVPVASLLNPLPPSFERLREPSKTPARKHLEAYSSPLLPTKKQKMSKAAAPIMKAKPKGEINYPPYEECDEDTTAAYDEFEVQPIGQIQDYPKRIPYNSEKKTFQRKTGMDGFEVYQYTFRKPDEGRGRDAHAVMWDYNVGLVRITSFFKSLGHSKTMPAKVMTANPGLRDISHSITGGSISAQGYWVPYEAAKAVAARFCYNIRHVLVPLFGPDFVAMCHEPGSSGFMQLSIDSDIIYRCTEGATAILAQSRESSMPVSPRTPCAFPALPSWPPKPLLPKSFKAMDVESGYGTDSDRSDKYPGSPDSCSNSGWTPVNSPRLENFSFPRANVTSTPRELSEGHVGMVSGSNKKKNGAKRPLLQIDGASNNESSSDQSSIADTVSPKRRKITGGLTPEIGAACTLLQLNMADATLREGTGVRRRRASA